nr:xanthine dehydrogenase family protein molybdopterin-binding subunit [Sphingomonas sp. Y57]
MSSKPGSDADEALRGGGAASRRGFLGLAMIAGSDFTLGLILPPAARAMAQDAAAPPFASPFVRISADNVVTIISKHLEMGQGVHSGLSLMVAEELDAAWSQIRVVDAPVNPALYANLMMDPQGRAQVTGGSMSTAGSWEQMRRAGATVRAMLVQAAANEWRVEAGEIGVADGIVRHAGSGRSASFGSLAARAARLPIPEKIVLKDPAAFKLIGTVGVRRLDGAAKSTGREEYAGDVKLPGMMTAVLARSPRFGGKVGRFDAAKALAVPGVVDVVEVPRGIAVVAKTMWQALQGRRVLDIEWNDSAAEMRGSEQLWAEYRRLAAGERAVTVARKGDARAVLAACHKSVSAEFEFPFLAHAAMEPLVAVARYGPDRCEIWAGAQYQSNDREAAAAVAGLKPEQVEIHTLAAGGSFGRRQLPHYIMEAVSIAKATGGKYPVRLLWTREDDIQSAYYRPMNFHRITAGIDEAGNLAAYQQRIVGQSLLRGTPLEWMIRNGNDFTATGGNFPEEYDHETVDISWTEATNGIPVQFWRSVQHSHMAFSLEVMIDELAFLAGKDPVLFREGLLAKRPRTLSTLRLATEKAGWGTPVRQKAGMRRGRGVAVHEAMGSVVCHVAEVSVIGDEIKVDKVVTAVECGLAVMPDMVRAQMESGIVFGLSAALHGEISLTGGVVDQSNYHDYRPLRIEECPDIEVHIVPSANPPSGVGEPGVPPIAPAVANAVRAATGIGLRRLPFDLAAARRAARG